ncbi:hypothetical protein PMAYCL1PPCAC_14341, partial [Pristionchus mayeri]
DPKLEPVDFDQSIPCYNEESATGTVDLKIKDEEILDDGMMVPKVEPIDYSEEVPDEIQNSSLIQPKEEPIDDYDESGPNELQAHPREPKEEPADYNETDLFRQIPIEPKEEPVDYSEPVSDESQLDFDDIPVKEEDMMSDEEVTVTCRAKVGKPLSISSPRKRTRVQHLKSTRVKDIKNKMRTPSKTANPYVRKPKQPYVLEELPPKRPRSAFFLFLSERREELKKPGMGIGDVAKAAGAEWRAMEDKSEWTKKEEEDKERWKREMEEFRRRGPEKIYVPPIESTK